VTNNPAPTIELDCIGMKCPAPVIRIAREAAALRSSGGFLLIRADDPAFRPDVEAWVRSSGSTLIEVVDEGGGVLRAVVQVAGEGVARRAAQEPARPASTGVLSVSLDLRGVQCPGPVIALAKLASQHPTGTEVRLIADDPAFPLDLRSWVASGRAELVSLDDTGPEFHAHLRIGAKPNSKPIATIPVAPRPSSETALAPTHQTSNRCTLLVLHNDHEALLAALLVANGAAAQGMETSLFFTFWGLNLLRGDHPDPTQPRERVGIMQRLMKWMMPKGPTRQKLGQMHFGGFGKGMLNSIMRSQNILGLPELMRSALELGVTFTACTMSMGVMGITKRDLYPYPNLEYAGVATFVDRARQSSISLVF
jgi:TusA-related sulfurtransferase/peroxiredoxin family protein